MTEKYKRMTRWSHPLIVLDKVICLEEFMIKRRMIGTYAISNGMTDVRGI